MKLTSLQLRDITCYDDLKLQFTNVTTGEPSPWIVLLGENGTGKSIVLQMIGAALAGPTQLSAIAGDIDWNAYVRTEGDLLPGTEPGGGQVTLWMQRDPGDMLFGNNAGIDPADEFRSRFTVGRNSTQQRIGIDFTSQPELATLHGMSPEGGWFGCGYSPWRRSSRRQKSGGGQSFPTLSEFSRAFRFGTLFGDERGLKSVSEWIADLDFAARHDQRIPQDEARFNTVLEVLKTVLPEVTFDSVTRYREVIFWESGTRVPMERLSDGYLNTLVWTMDLVRLLGEAFPDSISPQKERGVVLIDEIDLHLHPRLQREVVERTRLLFENLQFIVTTHSPFVAQDMRPQDKLIVLKRSATGSRKRDSKTPHPVVAEQGSGFAQGWCADQILTSYLFGLEGTRNQSVLKDEREYENLLDAEANGTLTERRKLRLGKMRRDLERVMSSPGETVEQREIYEAANGVIEALSGVRVPSRKEAAALPDDDNDLFLNQNPNDG